MPFRRKHLLSAAATAASHLAGMYFPQFSPFINPLLDMAIKYAADSEPDTTNPTFGWIPSQPMPKPPPASRKLEKAAIALSAKVPSQPALNPYSAYMSSSQFSDHTLEGLYDKLGFAFFNRRPKKPEPVPETIEEIKEVIMPEPKKRRHRKRTAEIVV